jgi:hypothetical protein
LVVIKKSFLSLFGTRNHLAFGFESECGPGAWRGEHTPFAVAARDLQLLGGTQIFGMVHAPSAIGGLPEEHAGAGGRLEWGSGAIFRLSEHAGFSSELNFALLDGETRQLFWTPGLTWTAPGIGVFGAGVSTAITGPSRDWRVALRFIPEFRTFRGLLR